MRAMVVLPATLSSRIKTARQAVGDDGTAQRVIRTVRGRGFRFVADVEVVEDGASAATGRTGGRMSPAARLVAHDRSAPAQRQEPPGQLLAPRLVAREEELARLASVFDRARDAERQIALLTGEPGIGKTTLSEAFLAAVVEAHPETRVARGQCMEQRGAGEAYLPVLDALGRLGRSPDHDLVAGVLERHAPTWLLQLPSLATSEQLERAERRSVGASRERMLREMVEALEALSATSPLILALEDLHWSDPSTLDLLAWIAQRPESARLMIVATLRPSDANELVRAALTQVRRSGRATEIRLERWGEAELSEFCEIRFGSSFPADLLRVARERTDGNPLFVETLIEAWIDERAVERTAAGWRAARPLEALAADVPESLRALLEQRVEGLSEEEQRVLEAASSVGPVFSSALVAAALEVDEGAADAVCHTLARRGQIIRRSGVHEWPSGRSSSRFAFGHHLFRDALYERIPHTLRHRLHARVAARLLALQGDRADEVANELALQFRLAEERLPAIEFLARAARRALGRNAHREAAVHLTEALELLGSGEGLGLDETEVWRMELSLQRMLGPVLLFTRGWGDADVERAYERCRAITERLGDREKLAQVLYGMAYLHEIRGDFHLSEPLLEECLGLGEKVRTPYTSIESQELLSCSLFHQGRFQEALRSARAALAVFEPDTGDPFAASLGMNAGVASHYWEGLALWCLGFPDRARGPLEAAVRAAGHAQLIFMQASAHAQSAELFHFRRELEPLIEHAEKALTISERQGYPFHHAIALTLRGWARVMEGAVEEGLAAIARGLEMQRSAGADIERPYGLGLYAEALLHAGRIDDGLSAVDEAIEIIGRRARAFFWEAELHRLRGELLLKRGADEEAERSLRTALATAQRQDALSLQLRAAMSLARLESDHPGQRRGADEPARELVGALYARFGEGFDTADLRDARAMLA
jgi:tetratricopeptide (TPR) repeat protein